MWDATLVQNMLWPCGDLCVRLKLEFYQTAITDIFNHILIIVMLLQ